MTRSGLEFWFTAFGSCAGLFLLALLLSAYVPRQWIHLADFLLSLPTIGFAFYYWHRTRTWFVGSVTFLVLGIAVHTSYYGLWNIMGRPVFEWHDLAPNVARVMWGIAMLMFIVTAIAPSRRRG